MSVAALTIALAACSARTPAAGDTEPSISAPPTSPGPSVTASPAARRARKAVAAVYALEGGLWYYDVAADTVHKLTQGPGIRAPRWIGPDEISFLQDRLQGERSSTLFRVNVRTGAIAEVFAVETGVATYGWSPDGTTVAYVTVDDLDFPQIHFRSLAGGGSVRTVATLARQLGREYVDDDLLRIAYAPDGEHVLIVYTIASGEGGELALEESAVQVRTADGALAYAPAPENGPTMAFWAPDGARMLFRIRSGARSWQVQGGRVEWVPGKPVWFDPSPSPDGRLVAFDTGASSPSSRIRLVDLRAGTIRPLGGPGRAYPIFATTAQVWAQRIRACAGDCLVPGQPVNEVVAIEVATGKERRLAIRSLLDVDVRYA